jgi:GMP synthase-like glutamine amidotransferase
VPDVLAGRALVLVHDASPARREAGVGSVGPALVALGFDVAVTTLVTGDPPPDPRGYDVVVVLGAAESADDDTVPWLAAELDLIARAVAADVAVLGICFGAQALARVLGGRVGRAPRSEHGFVTLDSADPDLLEPGTWLEFHDDAFTLPPGATPLARNEAGLQAFGLGPHLGVQFHPEITPDVLTAWTQVGAERGVDQDAVAAAVDLPALRTELAARAPATAAACHRLVARFCNRAGVPTR